ncbi:MAG: ABC transporter permease [Acidobacteriota bacterium]
MSLLQRTTKHAGLKRGATKTRWMMFNLRVLFHKTRAEKEMDDELRFHLEKQIEQNIAGGMSPEEARYAALRQFGNVGAVKEECRDAWGVRFINELAQDVRYGLRQLRRNPGFTAVAVVTLALGIGANTAIFSVIDGVLLAPLPYHQSNRLVVVGQINQHGQHQPVSYPDFRDWQRSAHSFQQIAAYHFEAHDLTNPGQPKHLYGKGVTPNFFSTLGVKLALGREFTPQEDRYGGTPVAIISNRLWRNRFAGSPAALGKVVTLEGRDYTVVGVLPRGFRYEGHADVYRPLAQGNPSVLNNRAIHPGIFAVARLKPESNVAQAQADMNSIQQSLDHLYPNPDKGFSVDVMSLKQANVGYVDGMLLMLLGAVALVLLIACSNVASLLLARAAARTRELAVRSALGASRTRVVRQLLTESVLLSLAGGALGLGVATLGTNSILAAVPINFPRSQNIGVNGPVLWFTFGVSILVGILFGLVPALKGSKVSLEASLKEGSQDFSKSRHPAQNTLVIFQVALTLVLLAGAGLLFRTIVHLWNVNPGFDAQHVITFKVGLSPSVTSTPAKIRTAYRQLAERVREIPGVQAADHTTLLPLSHQDAEIPFWVGSQKPASIAQAPSAVMYETGPDYLRAMGIPLLRGRFFTAADTTSSAPVAVIDSTLARSYFPGKNPIGRTLTIPNAGPIRIVGLVGHVRHWGLSDSSRHTQNQIYFAFSQLPDQWLSLMYRNTTMIVRTRLDPAAVMPAIRKAVYGPSRDQPVYDVQTLRAFVAESMAWQHFPMILLAAFALLSLVLASVGLYGVISYSVNRRRHEIGIRMALGAKRRDVLKLVISQGLKLAIVGVVVGIAGALVLTRFLSSLLYGVKPTDPLTFIAVSLVLVAVALVACYIPARRAAKVDPMVALRYE